MTLWIAELETRNFHFLASGPTHRAALDALELGLKAHANQLNLDPSWFEARRADFRLREVKVGICYRDHDVLPA